MPGSSICVIFNYLSASLINYLVVLDSEKRKTLARPEAGTVLVSEFSRSPGSPESLQIVQVLRLARFVQITQAVRIVPAVRIVQIVRVAQIARLAQTGRIV